MGAFLVAATAFDVAIAAHVVAMAAQIAAIAAIHSDDMIKAPCFSADRGVSGGVRGACQSRAPRTPLSSEPCASGSSKNDG
jgi:hypothetical protein